MFKNWRKHVRWSAVHYLSPSLIYRNYIVNTAICTATLLSTFTEVILLHGVIIYNVNSQLCLWITANVQVCIIYSDSSVKSCKFRGNLHVALLTLSLPVQAWMSPPPEGQEFVLNFSTTFFVVTLNLLMVTLQQVIFISPCTYPFLVWPFLCTNI